MEEPLIYREEVTAIIGAFADIVAEIRRIRKPSKMGKKRKRTWGSDEERRAWDRHIDETIRNLRELAAGRAERAWREKQGKPAG